MSWSTPSSLSTGTLVTAATWNQDVKDNAIALRAGSLAVTSQAIGDILYASSTTQFARVAAVAAGQVLTSAGTGTVPAYSATPALTSVDMGGTTVYGSRAITVDTGGVLNIVLASASGDDFTIDTDKLVVSGDTGYIGMGQADPQHYLDIDVGTSLVQIRTLNNNALQITENDADALGGDLAFKKSRGSYASPGDVVNADGIAGIKTNAYSGTQYWDTAQIDFAIDGTFTSNQRPPSRMTFSTNAANAAVTERMRIDDAGNIGINQTVPTHKLHVVGDIKLQSSQAHMSDGYGLLWGDNGFNGNAATDSLRFDTAGGQRLGINSAGLVSVGNNLTVTGNTGLGTASPGSKLDISVPAGAAQLTIQAGTSDSVTGEASIKLISRNAGSGSSPPAEIRNIWGGSNDSDLAFYTTTDGSTMVEHMRINDVGNVGIGVAAPTSLLDIRQAADGATEGISLFAGRIGTTESLNTYFNSGEWYIAPAYSGGGALSNLHFTTSVGGGNTLTLMKTGLVGIGTASPDSLLDLESAADAPTLTIHSTIATGGGVKTGGVLSMEQQGGTGEPSQTNDTPGSIVFSGQANDYQFTAGYINSIVETGGDVGRTSMVAGIQFLTKTSGAAGAAEKMRITGAGLVGIGEVAPAYPLSVAGTKVSIGSSAGVANNGAGLILNGWNIYPNWQIDAALTGSNGFAITPSTANGGLTFTTPALTISNVGLVNVVGTFTAGTKTFQIPHPLPALKDTHHLIHACLEGPRLDLIYRSTVTLVDGAATVDLDDSAGMAAGTWALLCRDAQVFTTNETGWFHVRGTVSGSTLTIECEEGTCTDTVSWMVVAERQDDEIKAQSSTDEDGHLIIEPLQVEEEPDPEEDDDDDEPA